MSRQMSHWRAALCLVLAAAATQPSVTIIHPRSGGFVTANSQKNIILDTVVSNFRFPEDGSICIDVGATDMNCYDSPTALAVSISSIGQYTVKAHLTTEHRTDGATASRESIVASHEVSFTAEDTSTCVNSTGRPPCGRVMPQCTSMLKFRFFLHPAAKVPSKQAAMLYNELYAHPMRTSSSNDACIFIGIGDIMVSNTPWVTDAEASHLLTRQSTWGSGEYNLVFNFCDYASGYGTGRAMLARSSFGPPIDQAWFNPANPRAVPQMEQFRTGYDIVLPLPFYRCGLPDFTHLQRFSDHRARSAVRPPSERRILASFKGAIHDFPPSHHAFVRRALLELADEKDVVIAPTCWSVAPACKCSGQNPCPPMNATTSSDARCFGWHARSTALDFERLMLESMFAFVAPGEGTHSYRLYEALQAGAVPILLGLSARPLPEVIDWEDIAIIQEDTSVEGLKALLARLRAMPAADVDRMAARGHAVFEANLRNLEAMLSSTFAALSLRFQAAAEAEGGSSNGHHSSSRGTGPAASHAEGSSNRRTGGSSPQPPPLQSPVAEPPPVSELLDSASIDADGIARLSGRKQQQQQQQQRAPHSRSSPTASVYALKRIEADGAAASVSLVQRAAQLWEVFIMELSSAAYSQSATLQIDTGNLRRAVVLLLHWLAVSVHAHAGGQFISPLYREEAISAYYMLSQMYSALGHWRHSATAAQALACFHPYDGAPSRGVTETLATLRGRNSLFDSRRDVHHGLQYVRPAVALGTRTTQRLFRVQEHLLDGDELLFSGYGALSAFLSSAPLGAIDSPAYTLPLAPAPAAAPRGDAADGAHGVDELRLLAALGHPDTVLPFVAVDESTLQSVAARVAPALSEKRLSAFMSAHEVASPGLIHAQFLNGPNASFSSQSGAAEEPDGDSAVDTDDAAASSRSRLAIVSLCAYNSSQSNLASLSVINLQNYCDLHGYDCFVGTQVLDGRRVPAWSKMLMVAQFLPSYEWVLWRDCDSFIMNPSRRVEDVIAAAAASRALIARAVTQEVAHLTSPTEGGAGTANGAAPPRVHSGVLHANRTWQPDAPSCNTAPCTSDAVASAAADTATMPGHPSCTCGGSIHVSSGMRVIPIAATSMDMVVSEDGLMLNTGVFMLRNCVWSRSFVGRVYGLRDAAAATATCREGGACGNDSEWPFFNALPVADAAAAAGAGAGLFPPPRRTNPGCEHSTAAAADSEGKRLVTVMRRAPLPFDANRAWEQASALIQLSLNHTLAGLPSINHAAGANEGAVVAAIDAALVATVDSGAAVLTELRNFFDGMHAQFVPQAWMNSYPHDLADKLHDHHGKGMHETYEGGDWIISFSGCAVMLSAEVCEALFARYAAEAAGALAKFTVTSRDG